MNTSPNLHLVTSEPNTSEIGSAEPTAETLCYTISAGVVLYWRSRGAAISYLESVGAKHEPMPWHGGQSNDVKVVADALAHQTYESTVSVPASAQRQEKRLGWPQLPQPSERRGATDSHAVALAVRDHLHRHLAHAILLSQGSLYLYEDGVWRELPESWIHGVIQQFSHKIYTERSVYTGSKQRKIKTPWTSSPRNREAVLGELLQLLTEEQLQETVTPFSKYKILATFSDRTLYLENGVPYWSAHTPEARALFAYDFEYSPGLEPTFLLRVMRSDWFGGLPEGEREARIQCLREFIGHCFLGSLPYVNISKMLVCVGHGHDGKSTLQSLVRRCLPPNSYSSLQIHHLSGGYGGGEFNRARLDGVTCNLIDDMGFTPIQENEAFKSATAYKHISARPKEGKPYEFVPRAAWWGLVNITSSGELPEMRGQSEGLVRRFQCIEFPRSVSQTSFDPHLEDKLYNAEKREIVCWAIDAALEMITSGRSVLTTPACHAEVMTQWRLSGSTNQRDFDPVAAFRKDECEQGVSDSDWTSLDHLFAQFGIWVGNSGGSEFHQARAQISKSAFAKALVTSGVKSRRIKSKGNRTTQYHLRHISPYVHADDVKVAPTVLTTFEAKALPVIEQRDLPAELRWGVNDEPTVYTSRTIVDSDDEFYDNLADPAEEAF